MIRIICPRDPTIRCVERQARKLERRLRDLSRVYVVMPTDETKFKCHRLIREWNNADLIVFMGHGRSDALFGSRGKNYDAAGADDCEDMKTEDYYHDEHFLDQTNYGLLSGKRFVCFACDSDLLANRLVESGAVSVLGVGKMPTSLEEFNRDLPKIQPVKTSMIACINGALNVAFRDAVIDAARINGNMGDIAVFLKMELRRQISLLLHSKAVYRFSLTSVLYGVADSAVVVGDKTVSVLG